MKTVWYGWKLQNEVSKSTLSWDWLFVQNHQWFEQHKLNSIHLHHVAVVAEIWERHVTTLVKEKLSAPWDTTRGTWEKRFSLLQFGWTGPLSEMGKARIGWRRGGAAVLVCVWGRRGGGRPLVWSVLCDGAISAISSGDKRRESLLSQYGSWPFNSPSVCVTLSRESCHTRYSDTHVHARTHTGERSNANWECGRNWQPADGRLQRQWSRSNVGRKQDELLLSCGLIICIEKSDPC